MGAHAHPRSASQTIGPYFGFALPSAAGPWVVREGTPGAIALRGRLFDGQGAPITDGLIESWQSDPQGRFPADAMQAARFRGFGRCATDAEGRYAIVTLKPGAVHGAGDVVHAPQIVLSVFARGLLKRAVTRVYFPDERAANDADPVLSGLSDAALRATLVAVAIDGGYEFDIRMQGPGETVFFDV
jgi:protocatechuate 3,4-dioxygenase alpha subunit